MTDKKWTSLYSDTCKATVVKRTEITTEPILIRMRRTKTMTKMKAVLLLLAVEAQEVAATDAVEAQDLPAREQEVKLEVMVALNSEGSRNPGQTATTKTEQMQLWSCAIAGFLLLNERPALQPTKVKVYLHGLHPLTDCRASLSRMFQAKGRELWILSMGR